MQVAQTRSWARCTAMSASKALVVTLAGLTPAGLASARFGPCPGPHPTVASVGKRHSRSKLPPCAIDAVYGCRGPPTIERRIEGSLSSGCTFVRAARLQSRQEVLTVECLARADTTLNGRPSVRSKQILPCREDLGRPLFDDPATPEEGLFGHPKLHRGREVGAAGAGGPSRSGPDPALAGPCLTPRSSRVFLANS